MSQLEDVFLNITHDIHHLYLDDTGIDLVFLGSKDAKRSFSVSSP